MFTGLVCDESYHEMYLAVNDLTTLSYIWQHYH